LTTSEKQLLIVIKQLILNEIRLILLDEPFSMGDPFQIQKLLDYLQKLSEDKNIVMIISSSNLEALEYICSEMGMLTDGNLNIGFDSIREFRSNLPSLFPFKPLEMPNSEDYNTKLSLNHVSYGNIIKNLSLNVYEGEILGIIGSNRSGKTSLLKLISGRLIADKGSISFLKDSSRDISKFGLDSINVLKKVIFLDQELAKPPTNIILSNFISSIIKFKKPNNIIKALEEAENMGIREEIFDFIMRKIQTPWNFPEKALSRVGLSVDTVFELFSKCSVDKSEIEKSNLLELFDVSSSLLNKRMDQISITEMKLIYLISHLLIKPEILILDEFDSGFDLISKRKICNNLLKINNQYQTTIIFSTHDPVFIKDLAYRAIVLEKGSIEQTGDSEEIYRYLDKYYKEKIPFLKD
jgi:ABC-type multidrug transport system ATPase subunit